VSNLDVHIPGPEIDAAKFVRLMYPRIDAPSDFDYLAERLLELRGILSAEEIRTPNNKDHKGDPMRYVVKRGLTTFTTIGCLTGFESCSPLLHRKICFEMMRRYGSSPEIMRQS